MNILGVILLDTPNTQEWKAFRQELDDYDPELPETTSARVREAVRRRFKESESLVYNWVFPSVADLRRLGSELHLPSERESYRFFPITQTASSGATCTELASLRFDLNFAESLCLQHQGDLFPPCMLVRASSKVPNTSAKGLIRVDLARTSPLLGWEDHSFRFIRVVQDTPGHHYNMFEGAEKVPSMKSLT